MRKAIYILLLAMILLLAACTGQINTDTTAASGSTGGTEGTGTVPEDQGKPLSGIVVNSPMTISNNLITYQGADAYLRLKMVKGQYYENWSSGILYGTIWEGSFVLELSDGHGKTLVQTDLGKYYPEPLAFAGNFELVFDDYNHDGNMDFTLGQYSPDFGYGRVYRLFTLKPDGTVEELEIKDMPRLSVSSYSGVYSTRLQKYGNTGFRVRFFDGDLGKTYESSYEWREGAFVGVDTREILPLEGYQEIMSDMSLSPADMLAYLRKHAGNASGEDAADLLLRLELLQKNYTGTLTDKYYADDSIQRELAKLYMEGTIPSAADNVKDAGLRKLLAHVHSSGFRTETAEGDFFPVIDYSIYQEFSTYIPEDMRGYFLLMAVESGQAPAKDGGLVISWDEVVKRALAQQQFLLSYGQSQKLEEVRELYRKYVSFIFQGLPNTPDFTYDTKTFNASLKDSLLRAAGENGTTPLEKAILGYLEVLNKNKDTLTDEVKQFRENTIAVLGVDSESAPGQ